MRVLVASDSKSGSDLLRRLLENLGHQVEDTVTVGTGAQLADEAGPWDVMVAAMVTGRSSRLRYGTVGVEIGTALGKGIPVLLVAKSSLSLPFLSGLPRLDYTDDTEFLEVQIGLLLSALTQERSTKGAVNTSVDRNRAVQSTGPGSETQGRSFEREVGALLRSSGAEVIEQVRLSPEIGRPDFSLLFASGANNLEMAIIEVKTISPAKNRAAAKQLLAQQTRQLSAKVLAAQAGLGLLVYEGADLRLRSSPMTVALSWDELNERLAASKSLNQVLRQIRNEAVHAL